MEQFEQFAAEHGLTLTAQNVAMRPDPTDDSWAKDALHFHCVITKPDTTDGFKAKRPPVVVWAGYYSVGSAHPFNWAGDSARCKDSTARTAWRNLDNKRIPVRGVSVHDSKCRDTIRNRFAALAPLQIADILLSLKMDSSDWDSTFDDWVEGLGMDTDSRKAFDIFQVCQTTAKTIRRTLGPVAFEAFLNLEEV
jgi:hypothetical protein